MAISNLLTGRVRVKSPKNVTSDRYQFLDLSQAEPNLGVPNFSASLLTNPAIVVSDDQGNRGFVRSLDLDRVTGQFTGSFSGSYVGDGSELFNLPSATKISSGSATASFVEGNLLINTNTRVQGNLYVDDTIYAEQLLVSYISSSVIYSSGSNVFGDESTDIQQFTGSVEIRDYLRFNEATGSSISASFTGSFFGDGANLFNLPQATKLASGSVTASVSPDDGLKVESWESGSQFTGSIFVSGSRGIELTSGSSFSGSGARLFDIPRSALTPDALLSTFIVSGSVTASVSPQYGFRVESALSGSEFTGSIDVSGSVSASLFIGDGSRLFNLPALSATLIASGSVTASVAPDKGFIVTSKDFGSQFTGSIFVSGSRGIELTSGSSFSGSGARLFDIPRTALTPDALISNLIASGSVTASVSDVYGFVVKSPTSGSQITGSIRVSGSAYVESGSIFVGDGSGLRNIPLSALSEEVVAATKITSGSVTASVSPAFGFKVESIASGSQFSGSLFVSGGNVQLQSGSFFSGSGRGLFDIPRSALSEEVFRIASGSVTASVSPDFGFVVVSPDSGSIFSGSVFLSSGSFFSGSGEKLFNIPKSAISDLDLSLIFSGSATASINPVNGFVVNTPTTISGSLIVSSSNYAIPTSSIDTTYFVTNNSFSSYGFTGAQVGSNIQVTLVRGITYRFVVNASGHPFWIKTAPTTGTGDAYNDGVTNNGTDNGVVTFEVTETTPSTLYYVCQNHSVMNGTISVSDALYKKAEIKFIGDTQLTGSLKISSTVTASMFSGSGRGLFDIPVSSLSSEVFRVASGSVTASVSPVYGFRVESKLEGSEFTGSVEISGSLKAERIFSPDFTGSFEGDGSRLKNVPSVESNRIVSGSVTASVSPDLGFVVISTEKGSTISGSLTVSGSVFAYGNIELRSGSAFSGSGERLFNIPRTALTPDALLSVEIKSGSVTASEI